MKPTPAINIVDQISLSYADVYMPIHELVVNSIISIGLAYKKDVATEGRIEINISRSAADEYSEYGVINKVEVIDNGIGFTDKNFESFETPHSSTYRSLGCKGMGRFTCLAAFQKMEIQSVYKEGEKWRSKCFEFDVLNEVSEPLELEKFDKKQSTSVVLYLYKSQELQLASKAPTSNFAYELMEHCLVYYIDSSLPQVIINDSALESSIVLKDFYSDLTNESEKIFYVKKKKFKAFILRTQKMKNRKNHYVHYCANSRQVGKGRNLSNLNKLFAYPITKNGMPYLLDIYVVSKYLNDKNNPIRTNFNIPISLFDNESIITFQDIENKLASLLEKEFHEFYLESQNRAVEKTKGYIRTKGIEYRRYLSRTDILKRIPPFSDEKTIDEILHKISYEEKIELDKNWEKYIAEKAVNEDLVEKFTKDLKKRTAFDADSLADYICRRKAILKMYDKLLQADKEGKYKLENDIHKIVMPLGACGNPLETAHNLWILDERFVTYSFVSSDLPIQKNSQKKSALKPDVLLWKDNADILNKPTAFGSTQSGEIDSLVVFEFKRPGETAWQMSKANKEWDYSFLIDKYFNAFLYGDDKKNYKGRPVVIKRTTPKFGYIILDVIPNALEDYNRDQGYKRTPYGTIFKIIPEKNLHIEVITFEQLLESANRRHKPFFDKLFVHDL